jgi:DNA-directed RNA polymerase subunit alpha
MGYKSRAFRTTFFGSFAMTAAREVIDFGEILSAEDLSLSQLHDLRREIHCHAELRDQLEALVGDFGKIASKLSSENKATVRRGVALWLLGRSEDAIAVLEPTRTSKERNYIFGLCCLEAERPNDALPALKEAASSDSSDPLISQAVCEAKIKSGHHDEAKTHLERLLKKSPGSDVYYLKGLLADLEGYYDDAVAAYEKALEAEPGHARSLFRLAYVMDLSGEDARAMELYDQLRKLRPIHVNAMMNLGVLHEDRGDFERAAQCYQAVLDYFPNHRRARLYLSDAHASLTMYYDEEAARRDAKVQQILGQPVADFSFSPRVRNALQKLGVSSLGELVNKAEEDLLTVPNFGRTSLKELKEFLGSKGLSLASSGGPGGEAGGEAGSGRASGDEDLLEKNLADFGWSGRIQRVFEKMGLVTVGDLTDKSEEELLKNKNLGQTSVKEIRRKLGQLGLSLSDG